jgi:dephospho-CoA kinase
MTKRIIGLAGQPGSGKDEAARYLVERHGAVALGFSTILRDLLRRLHIPEERDAMSSLSSALRGCFGQDLFGRVLAEDISRDPHPLVVVSGIRRDEDMVGFEHNPAFQLVYIDAPAEVRFERIHRRGQNADDATKTWEEFLADEDLEAERTVKALRSRAQIVLDNSGSREAFFHQLDALASVRA